jgi:7-carboxy-7-deazaguanine synthase
MAKQKINTEHLSISEKFYSIQGEGRTMGFPAIFLRLSGCNLLCKSDDWICDSIEVWKKGIKTTFEDVFDPLDIERLKNGVHLVITGGEPMLHQNQIIEFFKWFREEHGFKPYIEVETNGTVLPERALYLYINQWNVSPKLLNSGEDFDKRFNLQVLKTLNGTNSMFKFVIKNELDVIEIFTNYGFLKKQKIYLMPAGATQEELNAVRTDVIELCKKYILKYTERLHIVAWNKKTGV